MMTGPPHERIVVGAQDLQNARSVREAECDCRIEQTPASTTPISAQPVESGDEEPTCELNPTSSYTPGRRAGQVHNPERRWERRARFPVPAGSGTARRSPQMPGKLAAGAQSRSIRQA